MSGWPTGRWQVRSFWSWRGVPLVNDGAEQSISGHNQSMPLNVLGGELETCSMNPRTGWFRDGCCKTDGNDQGIHTVCAIVTNEFLAFSADVGNDLSTPRPEFGFPGLKDGDQWCVCAPRWAEALEAGKAPKVVLAATHARTLDWCDLDDLRRFAIDDNS